MRGRWTFTSQQFPAQKLQFYGAPDQLNLQLEICQVAQVSRSVSHAPPASQNHNGPSSGKALSTVLALDFSRTLKIQRRLSHLSLTNRVSILQFGFGLRLL